jgi:hypothetical protein
MFPRKADINSHPIFNSEVPKSSELSQNMFEDFGMTNGNKTSSGLSASENNSSHNDSTSFTNPERTVNPSPILSPQTSVNRNSGPKSQTSQQTKPNYNSLSNDLMSSLISNNLKQMGTGSPQVEMSSSMSMPLGMSNIGQSSSNTLPRSPTVGFGMSQPSTLSSYQMPRPSFNPSGMPGKSSMGQQAPYSMNTMSFNPSNTPVMGVMKPMGPSVTPNNDKNVKALSKMDIEDLLN